MPRRYALVWALTDLIENGSFNEAAASNAAEI